MVKDIYNHKRIFEEWRKEVDEVGIVGLNVVNSKIVLDFIDDMHKGQNTAQKSKNGARGYNRLNTVRRRIISLVKQLEKRGVKDIKKLKEQQLVDLFDDYRKGVIVKSDGSEYKAIADFVKDFRCFYHWLMKVEKKLYMSSNKKKGSEMQDITEDLDTSRSKPKFVYFTKEELEQTLPYFNQDEQELLLFAFDTGIRTGKELSNIKVCDLKFGKGFPEVNIRDEIAKSFGRRVKLLLCGDAVKKRIERKELQADDFLFEYSVVYMNRKMKQVFKQVFADKVSDGGGKYKDVSLYDCRHSSAIHWRLGSYRSKIDALMYRLGHSDLKMLNYYTETIGMKDSIEPDDMLVDVDKTELDKIKASDSIKTAQIEQIINDYAKIKSEFAKFKQLYKIS